VIDPSFDFRLPQHFTSGTIGPKGQRVFYLQFGDAGEIVSLKLEKGQLFTLADFLEQLLEEVNVEEGAVPLALDLIEPVVPAWAVASIGVAYDPATHQFILAITQLVFEDEDGNEPEAATAELHLSPEQVTAFVSRSHDLVASGRPPCAYCGRPLDDADGWCPCYN
jgi:uncharacterized repeat protein (TIGR03847 family)